MGEKCGGKGGKGVLKDKDNAHFDLRNIVKKVMLGCGRQGRARDTDARAHTHTHFDRCGNYGETERWTCHSALTLSSSLSSTTRYT